jgi:hypothetical protein
MKKSALLELLKDKEVIKVIGQILDTKKTEITTAEILKDLNRSDNWFYRMRKDTSVKLESVRKSGRENVYRYKIYTLWKRELKERELI